MKAFVPGLSLAVIAVLLTAPVAFAQGFGLDSYSVISPFGIATATDSNLMAMGGIQACIWAHGSANPAFSALQTQKAAGWRWTATEFDNGMDLTSNHAWFVMPWKENKKGFQLTVFSLHSGDGVVEVPGGFAAAELTETDFSLDFGQRITNRLSLGVSVSPMNKRELEVTVPGSGDLIFGNTAESTIGGRLGMAYEFGEKRANGRGDFVGLSYDYYQDEAEGIGFGMPAEGAERTFWNDQLAVGASYHLSDALSVACEYQTASINDGDFHRSLHGWHVGGQYLAANGAAVQLGLNDGNLTAGFGFENDRWDVAYAFVSDWNEEITGDLFGGSDTHTAQIRYHW
jgi:hypothetical protein